MHDLSTRALHYRRQGRARTFAALVAAFLAMLAITLLGATFATSASSSPTDTDTLARAPDASFSPGDDNVAHDIAITLVPPGQEGLDLEARLEEGGGTIERPIKWRVITSEGLVAYDAETPVADFAAEPGDYLVDIRYGAAHFTRGVSLLPGNRLNVNFVLNVGGLRILPQVKGLGLPQTPSHSRIFALGGLHEGQLIAESTVPGDILRLPAGDYRVESRFDAGNAVAVADVKVKPGRLSAVEIDHAAGVARLAFVGAPDADVAWKVVSDAGEPLATLSGLNAAVVLRPGTYKASAFTGAETLSATFAITAGEARDIILGN